MGKCYKMPMLCDFLKNTNDKNFIVFQAVKGQNKGQNYTALLREKHYLIYNSIAGICENG